MNDHPLVHEPLPLAKLPGTNVDMPGELVPMLVPIDSIREDPENPRVAKDVDHLAGLMRRFGYTDPVAINVSGMLEAGHQRLAAARRLGATHIPRVVLTHDATTAMAYNIAHNKSQEKVAAWDRDALVVLLGRLNEEDAAEGLGFDGDELAELLGELEAKVVGAGKEIDPDAIVDYDEERDFYHVKILDVPPSMKDAVVEAVNAALKEVAGGNLTAIAY
jgi:ParB-like chromosome segregation protein Spo0J